MSARPVSKVARKTAVLAAALAVAFVPGRLRADDLENGADLVAGIQRQIQSVFAKCRSAVVRIEASDAHGRLAGSGFFVDPNGTLFTSYSIGGETDDIVAIFGGVRHPAHRMVSDLPSGIAILKVDAETPFLTLGHSRDLAIASPVITVGYPFDLPITPSFGTIAGRDMKYLGRDFATMHLRANVPVQRGQGGAPLLDLQGRVVGVLISSLDQGSASFVLPIEAAEKIQHDFMRFHEVRRGWIGFELEPLAEPQSGSSVIVKTVFPDSPAAKAGVEPGDLVRQIGDHPIATLDDVIDACFFLTADDPAPLHVIRDDKDVALQLQPIDEPSDHPGGSGGMQRIAPAFTAGPELKIPQLTDEK